MAPSTSGQGKKRGSPRALAVLELAPNEAAPAPPKEKPLAVGVGFPRLYPVTVLDNGNYNDGTVYQASPVPLAVQSEVLYDVQHAGVQIGSFTVNKPTQLHGAWVGTGNWEPGFKVNISGEPPPEAKEDEGPPRLKRSTAASKSSQAKKVDAPWARARWLPAISDTDKYDTRPYDYPWTPEWKKRYSAELLVLAQRELAAYTKCQAARGKPCTMKLDDVDLRAFDLETNNDAQLVLTARTERSAGGKQQNIYVTLIGRVGWQGQVAKVFSSVTDDAHLDGVGRLEFVDAVDADGDGRGELLFRRVHDATQAFELYRVGRERVFKLFDGAESSL